MCACVSVVWVVCVCMKEWESSTGGFSALFCHAHAFTHVSAWHQFYGTRTNTHSDMCVFEEFEEEESKFGWGGHQIKKADRKNTSEQRHLAIF